MSLILIQFNFGFFSYVRFIRGEGLKEGKEVYSKVMEMKHSISIPLKLSLSLTCNDTENLTFVNLFKPIFHLWRNQVIGVY